MCRGRAGTGLRPEREELEAPGLGRAWGRDGRAV